MNLAGLETYAKELDRHLHDFYLPFWRGPALDSENGGWMAWLANDLTPDRTKPKGLIVHARILWAFSAAYLARPEPVYLQMADRALAFLMDKFWDHQRGGACWRVNDRGMVIDDSKKIYGQAFVIYALSEYHRASGQIAALERAKELFTLIERHAHDPIYGGYIEVCRGDWSEAGPEARLSEKDLSEKKSMNNHLHVLEACANLYRAWPDAGVAARLKELTGLFLEKILEPAGTHLNHFFDGQWKVRSDSYTYGHDIEASWLLCEAAEVVGDARLIKQTRAAAVRMAEAVLSEGWSNDGGLSYEGRNGKIIDAGRECWPQAEAMVGFINAFQIAGEEKFLSSALRLWDFAQTKLVDRQHGEWFWRINPDGRPDPNLPKVSEWKGPYHVTRACLECSSRIQQIIHTAKIPAPL